MTAFIWTVENNGSDDLDISITFTFKNGQGSKKDKEGGVWTEPFQTDSEGRDVAGVLINQSFRDMKCVYALSGAKKVSHAVNTFSAVACGGFIEAHPKIFLFFFTDYIKQERVS